jgi:amino acid transporter
MDAPTASPATEGGLVRAIGARQMTAGIINVIIGGGIFALPAAVALGVGSAAPLAYLICSVAMGLIVLCFAEAGSRVSLTGGPYAYSEIAFGPYVGFLCGVLNWLAGTFAIAAVSTVFSGTLARLVPALSGGVAEGIVLALLFGALSLVNVRGVSQGARLNEITAVAKLLPLILFVIIGAFFVQPEYLGLGELPSARALGATALTLIFAFAGMEAALIPSGEVKDPARTVPRALFTAMAVVTVMYIAIQMVAQGILGPALGDPAIGRAPLAAAAGKFLGSGGAAFMLVGAAISTFGYVSGMTLATPRALFAFARDGFAPRALARVHTQHHTPHIAIIVQSSIAFLLAASGTFIRLVNLANIALLLLYLTCCLAAWELRRRDVRAGGIPFRVPGGAVVPWLASAVIVGMLFSATNAELAIVGIALGAATLIFFVTRGRRGAVQPSAS